MRSSLWLLLGWFSPRGFVYVGFPILMFVMSAMSLRLRKSHKLRAFDRATLLVAAACLLAAMLEFLSQEPEQMALLFAAVGDLALLDILDQFKSQVTPACGYMMPHLDA